MRITFKRVITFIFLCFLSLLTWNLLAKDSSLPTQTCNQPEKVQQELHIVTYRVHQILRDLNITNFLCYGSLWGQIRLSRILPWEDKTVLCILNEDIAAKDELFVARMFKNKGFTINYDITEGVYHVFALDDGKTLLVNLIVFELDKIVHMYRRIGLRRRILPPDCERLMLLDCFPPRLIKPPLPRKEFGGHLVPVPREGIEIQKYHFRDNWWKEIPLKNC